MAAAGARPGASDGRPAPAHLAIPQSLAHIPSEKLTTAVIGAWIFKAVRPVVPSQDEIDQEMTSPLGSVEAQLLRLEDLKAMAIASEDYERASRIKAPIRYRTHRV